MPKDTGIPTAAEIAAHAKSHPDEDGNGCWRDRNGDAWYAPYNPTDGLLPPRHAPYTPLGPVPWPVVDGPFATVAAAGSVATPWRDPSDPPSDGEQVVVAYVCSDGKVRAVSEPWPHHSHRQRVVAWTPLPESPYAKDRQRLADIEAEIRTLSAESDDIRRRIGTA